MTMTNTSKTRARRAVGYVRISRDREDETSTDTQEESIRAHCADRGWTLVDVVVEPGRSAFKANRNSRPGFKRAMATINTGAADTFVVWKTDRVCRSYDDLNDLARELESKGAGLTSTTENFIDTADPLLGKFLLSVLGFIGELESRQKSDRATAWHDHRRRNGTAPAGPPVLGYRRALDAHGKPLPNTLVLDPDAPLVREAAERIDSGESVNSTVKWLNDAGVRISNPGLKTALQSPTMAGLVSVELLERRAGARVVGDGATLVEGDWEPLLDRELWERVGAILRDPRRRAGTVGNQLRHPLVPIIRCECGGRMRTQGDNRTYHARRYLCVERGCLNGITQGPVDEMVTAQVLDKLDDATWRKLRANGSAHGPDPAEVERKLANMWQMVLDGTIEPDEYAEAKARWNGEIAAATREPVDLPEVDSVRGSWDGFGPAERLLVFRRTIKSLVIVQATRRGRGVDLSRITLDMID